MSREEFSEYVRRVMKQKGLNATDVERNSGNKIDRSHVSKFMRGVETNPSANAMMALAAGLGVNPHEVFTAVTGCPLDEGQLRAPDVAEILSILERVTTDAELLEALRGLIRLSKNGRVAVSELLKFSNEQKEPMRRRKRREKKGR